MAVLPQDNPPPSAAAAVSALCPRHRDAAHRSPVARLPPATREGAQVGWGRERREGRAQRGGDAVAAGRVPSAGGGCFPAGPRSGGEGELAPKRRFRGRGTWGGKVSAGRAGGRSVPR